MASASAETFPPMRVPTTCALAVAGARLEPYAAGMINPWGFDFNQEGDAFATDGAGYSGINYVFPGSNQQWSKTPGLPILPGMSDKHPKYCGLEIIDSLSCFLQPFL